MTLLLLLAMLSAPQGAIEATIRGTAEPLEVELLLRNADDEWTEVEHANLVYRHVTHPSVPTSSWCSADDPPSTADRMWRRWRCTEPSSGVDQKLSLSFMHDVLPSFR